MAEIAFSWLLAIAFAFGLIFSCLIFQDLSRRSGGAGRSAFTDKPVQVLEPIKRRWRPSVRGHDYPELLLEDMENRTESHEETNERKINA